MRNFLIAPSSNHCLFLIPYLSVQIGCDAEARRLHDMVRRTKNYKHVIGEPLVTDYKITEGWYSLDQYRLVVAGTGNLTGGSCGTRFQIVIQGNLLMNLFFKSTRVVCDQPMSVAKNHGTRACTHKYTCTRAQMHALIWNYETSYEMEIFHVTLCMPLSFSSEGSTINWGTLDENSFTLTAMVYGRPEGHGEDLEIRVRKCDDTFQYYLKPPSIRLAAYCFGKSMVYEMLF